MGSVRGIHDGRVRRTRGVNEADPCDPGHVIKGECRVSILVAGLRRTAPIREFSWRAFDMWSVKMPAASRKHAVCRLKLDGRTAAFRQEYACLGGV